MTLVLPLALFLIGLALSALFSGTETGFYRVSRLRLQVLAGTGDWLARILAWFAERPALFISTTLVGNNLANYLVSFAAVLLLQQLASASTTTVEFLATFVTTPIVFIFGELIPKRLFLQAPFRLLRITGPVFAVLAVVLFPVAVILWAYSRVLALFLTAPLDEARSEITSQELRRIMEEGEHAGLIVGMQRRIARAILESGAKPVSAFMQELSAIPHVSLDITWQHLAQQSSFKEEEFALVCESTGEGRYRGYVCLAELFLNPETPVRAFVRPIFRVYAEERLVSVLQELFRTREPLALVVNAKGQPVGVLIERALRRLYLVDSNS